ncbi:MAG: hydantoinase/oxoprolinase family protein [Desulfobacterales bacterium]
MKSTFRLGIDTGGTFTDLCLSDETTGRVEVAKVSSTPHNPAEAVISGIKKLIAEKDLKPDQIRFLIHGTTVATNALLEGKGAPTALITTAGFEDVILIGRQSRPRLYDFWAQRPNPVVRRCHCFGAPERILHTGEVLSPLDQAAVEAFVRQIRKQGILSIAVCLIHSYANPVHEQQIKSIIQRVHPQAFVTLSSEILPEYREYERTSTICINAYVMPKVNAYVRDLEDTLRQVGVASELYIMQSNGGVISAQMARKSSARTVLSGPAGGALIGVHLARALRAPNVITIDMGGTSSDICLIEASQPKMTTEADIEGYPIKLPMIDINTIGAGGGSIAWIDAGGALRVGPQSAGADPGPVCYGRGGDRPTVTDANVILGRINPAYLLGGEMCLHLEAARAMLAEKIAEPLGLDLMQAAEGIIAVVNANMIRGIRRVSVERGHDPRDFSLVPFGGAGPLHGVELARALNMSRVVIPAHPGIASAFGMLSADVRHDYVQTLIVTSDRVDGKRLDSIYQDLEAQGRTQLMREGFSGEMAVFSRRADMRYAGQSYELSLPVPAGPISTEALNSLFVQFHQAHQQSYGYCREKEPIEFVNLRLIAQGKLPGSRPAENRAGDQTPAPPLGTRTVWFQGRGLESSIYERSRLVCDQVISGPAVVEQLDSTIVVPPKFKGVVDIMGNLTIEQESGT